MRRQARRALGQRDTLGEHGIEKRQAADVDRVARASDDMVHLFDGDAIVRPDDLDITPSGVSRAAMTRDESIIVTLPSKSPRAHQLAAGPR